MMITTMQDDDIKKLLSDFYNKKRGTGRTTRMLEKAVNLASDGEIVLVIVHSNQMIEYVRRIIMNKIDKSDVHFMQNRVRFPGSGMIVFMAPPDISQRLRGWRFDHLLIDHTYHEIGYPYEFLWELRLREKRTPIKNKTNWEKIKEWSKSLMAS